MKDINVVNLMCRLTRDPDLRSLPSGTSVCSLRVAFSTSRKDGATGQWSEKPNYVDVTVWGKQGESCAKYLEKGRQVAVLGRLEWREYETEGGNKRQVHEIVAEQVQFVGGNRDDDSGGGFSGRGGGGASSADVPASTAGGADDDIPF